MGDGGGEQIGQWFPRLVKNLCSISSTFDMNATSKLKSILGTGGMMAKSEHMASKKEKVDSSEPPVASNAKSAMLMAAINKNAVSTGKGKTKAGAPSNASLLKKPEDKLLEKKQAGEKKTAVAKAAKVTEIALEGKPKELYPSRACTQRLKGWKTLWGYVGEVRVF